MKRQQALKDSQREKQLYALRLLVAGLLVLLLASALVWRYHHLQVENHKHYAAASEDNRVHVRPVPPVRGLIHDRNGELLAHNRPSFTLRIVKEHIDDLDALLAQLDQMVLISEQQIQRFKSVSNVGIPTRRFHCCITSASVNGPFWR